MTLKPSEIKSNQNNPRIIKGDKFKKLVQSLKDLPEMAEVRKVVVNKDHMILGGNMRFRAMVEAGWKAIPVDIVDWSEEKQRQFIIKDNIAGGEWDWDVLANEWDVEELEAWGLDVEKNNKDESNIEGDEVFTELFGERRDYIIIYADNDIDILNMETKFDDVTTYDRKGHKTRIKKRVYTWSELNEKMSS